MIEFNHISMTYPSGYTALNDVSFTIREGDMTVLLGPSGAGKSSIFNLLLCLATPSRGRILINQQDIQKINLRGHISMVFQTPQLLNEDNLFENIALPLIIGGYRQQIIRERTTAALKKVGLLAKASLKAKDLSSGERKLTEIARAIVTVPKILLVDEPTSNVDAETAIKMLNLFRAFNDVGMTLLIATHQQDLLKDIATKSLFIRDGKLEKAA